MFSVVNKPLKVKAVALETAIAYVMMTFCSSLAINLAVNNPNTGKLMMDIYNTLSDGLKKEVEFAANAIQFGATVAYNWEVETFKNIANEVRSWFVDNYNPVSEYGIVICSNDNDIIGFTDETAFQLYFRSGTDRCIYYLPDSILTIVNGKDPTTLPMYGSRVLNSSNCNSDQKYDAIILVPSCNLCCFSIFNDTGEYNSPASVTFYSDTGNSEYDPILKSSFLSLKFFNGRYFDMETKNIYQIQFNGTKYQFICLDDGSVYNDLSFPSKQAIVDWYLDQCGFYTDTYQNEKSYVEPESTEDVYNYDSTKTDAAQDYIDNLAGDTVSTVLPGTDEQAQTLVDNPSAVWDVSTVDYDGSINLPSVDSSVWFDKFPFCIPFDFIKLFSSFTAEPEAPKFHILVLPANSFGLSNEDIYWDIDFSDYDVLVKILRLFVGLGFLYFLMIKTRGLIGAGGGG